MAGTKETTEGPEELFVMGSIWDSLKKVDTAARGRVLSWVCAKNADLLDKEFGMAGIVGCDRKAGWDEKEIKEIARG